MGSTRFPITLISLVLHREVIWTGAMWDWTNVYVDVAKEVMAGTWKSEPMVGGSRRVM